MTSNWNAIQREIGRILLGEPRERPVGVPNLDVWRQQANWIHIKGDRRRRRTDGEAIEARPVLDLAPIFATLWRMGTVVAVTAFWDGGTYHLWIGRASSVEYGPDGMLGAFPPGFCGDLFVTAADPLGAVLDCGRHIMKLGGRPGPAAGTEDNTPLEAMAIAAGSDPVGFVGVLTPLPKDTVIGSILDLQEELSRLVNPSQLLKTDLTAQALMNLVSAEVEYRLAGMSDGLWEHHGFLLAPRRETLDRAAGAIVCALAGVATAQAPPLEWLPADPASRNPGAPTWLRSQEAGRLYGSPRRPLPGFAIEAASDFDVPRERKVEGKQLALGEIQVLRAGTRRPLTISLDELQRHVLICGVTGSGKTVTSFHVLRHLWRDHRVPWLVIEPVKGDYWRLAQMLEASDRTASDGVRVLTLGDATPASSNPVSLNPFAFPQEIPLSTHLDLLKSVFFAGFVLYPPMPYVLEMALVRTYEARGWDLVTSTWGGGQRDERFPTMSDLVRSVEEVCGELGWAGEMRANVRTSLLVRLENLRRGGKGLLLDGPSTWTLERLLDRPTVLELGAFGSDEEKAFVSGLIFGLLAEFREAETRAKVLPAGLRHLLVIEEAHRLFRRTATDQGSEGGNVRGQAVERIAGLLAELRSFGQGVLIIDQSPEKLAPDAVRNTSTKIAHRVVAAEDRATIARSANLSAAQERELATLAPGEAILAAESIREAVLMVVPFAAPTDPRPEDRVALLMKDARKTEEFGGTAAPFSHHCRGCNAIAEGRCGAVRAQVRQLLTGAVGRRRIIPGFWLAAAGDCGLPPCEALARRLEGTAAGPRPSAWPPR